jgi:hypothetical protein
MISFAALAIYLTVLVIVMYQSVIVVDNNPFAVLQALVMVAIVAGVPALLGMLNGMNIQKKSDDSRKKD